jgi:hypothetical protein
MSWPFESLGVVRALPDVWYGDGLPFRSQAYIVQRGFPFQVFMARHEWAANDNGWPLL